MKLLEDPSMMVVFIAFLFLLAPAALALLCTPPKQSSRSSSSNHQHHHHDNKILQLQRPHVYRSPAETLEHLAQECRRLGVDTFDVYGDFDKDTESSFLRKFEAEIANELGMEDGVFMPSGGMAQSIALLIHHSNSTKTDAAYSRLDDESTDPTSTTSSSSCCFACHHTSHLLLHEQNAFRELLHLEPLVISTTDDDQAKGISIPPMKFADVADLLNHHHQEQPRKGKNNNAVRISTLMLELPHREIGGKVTPWTDVLQMREYCREHHIKFHLDGARIFEATTGYNDNQHDEGLQLSLQEMTSVFDSVYISFYKGLGGMRGAMLLGSKEFCDQARIWLRRFGGNLYTLLPDAVSSWSGFRRQWRLESCNHEEDKTITILSFQDKKKKLVALVKILSDDPLVSQILSFDPNVPETNMVHGYLRGATTDQCAQVLDVVKKEQGIQVLSRVRQVPPDTPAHRLGYRSMFEWSIGEANGNISNTHFFQGWRQVAQGLLLLLGEGEEKESQE